MNLKNVLFFLKRSKKNQKTIKLINYLVKEVKKSKHWKYKTRWVSVPKIVEVTDYLMINENLSTSEREILLRLQYEVRKIGEKMHSNVMPLRAFKILTNTIKRSLRAV